jgi:hypothetical protein
MTVSSAKQVKDLWTEFCERFIKLGGVAENVELRAEDGYRGLFVRDPRKAFRLFVPERLLIPMDAITLEGGAVRIKPGVAVGDEVRDFFNDYQSHLSWQGGREDAAKFLLGMYALPDKVKTILRTEFRYKVSTEPPTPQKIFERFLNSRSITYNDKSIIMPMVELVNHSYKGVGYNFDQGIGLRGSSKAEIFAKYNEHDCWSKSLVYGFAPIERLAYSLPFEMFSNDRKKRILVRNKPSERVKNPTGEEVPKVERQGSDIHISYVLLGDRLDARRPIQIYRKSIKRYLEKDSDEFFETLANLNKQRFLRLLSACNDGDSFAHRLLRETAIRQLEALNAAVYGSWS